MGEFSRALGMAESFRYAPLLRNDKTGEVLQHDGKPKRAAEREFKLSPITFEVIAQWEQYLEEQAFGVIDRARQRAIKAGTFNATVFADKEQDLGERITAGRYSFFSKVSADAQNNFLSEGWKKFLLIRLQVLQPDVTAELVEEMVEEQADKIIQLLKRSDTPDPNSQSPTPVAPGAESEPKPSSPDLSKAA